MAFEMASMTEKAEASVPASDRQSSESKLEANLPADTQDESRESDPEASPRNVHGAIVR